MFREIEIDARVSLPIKIFENGVIPQSSVMTHLLKKLRVLKSSEEHGYFLAVTKLKSIGDGELKVGDCKHVQVTIPVSFYCRTFLPVKGEVMFGVVHMIHRSGVFLRSGPLKYIYLSAQLMPNFQYVQLKTQEIFLSDDFSRIEVDVAIRFVVFAVRWDNEKGFKVLASLVGDSLGPVSLPVFDEVDF